MAYFNDLFSDSKLRPFQTLKVILLCVPESVDSKMENRTENVDESMTDRYLLDVYGRGGRAAQLLKYYRMSVAPSWHYNTLHRCQEPPRWRYYWIHA
jgi:hypothetical protein